MPKFTFDENDTAIDGCALLNKSTPIKQITLGFARYGIVQGPSDLSITSQDAISDLGREYRTVVSETGSGDVLTSRNTSIALSVDAGSELAREFAIWSIERQTYAFQLTNGLFQYNIGDTVSVTLPIEGLQYGFTGVIVAYAENVPNETRIEVFGNVTWPRLVTDEGEDILTDDGDVILL